jgi:hypothetical protein
MSRITLAPNPAGTGTLTVAAPNTNTDRTITLPDATSTLATTADVAAAAGSLTLLGTIATTSGTSVTLSGLTLTSYKQLQCVFVGVSGSVANQPMTLRGNNIAPLTAITNVCYGGAVIDLTTGSFWSSVSNLPADLSGLGGASAGGGYSDLTTASTSITFGIYSGTFDAGSIRIYGVK